MLPVIRQIRNFVNLSGVFPPIITPFVSGKSQIIDYENLENNFKKWNQIPFRGYVVQGSNGEYAYLSENERVGIIHNVKKFADADKLIIAGGGCESTTATIDMCNKMHEAGADALLVVTPFFYKAGMTDHALVNFFSTVADNSKAPIILYSVPANTGLDLSANVAVELADHPNIIGLKDSGGDIVKLSDVISRTLDKDFQVLAGSASFLYPTLLMGGVGGICALANVLGEACCQLHDFWFKNDFKNAQRLQYRLIAPNQIVTRIFGVSGLKYSMDWFGYYGGNPRQPLEPLSNENSEVLKKAFIDNGFDPRM